MCDVIKIRLRKRDERRSEKETIKKDKRRIFMTSHKSISSAFKKFSMKNYDTLY